MVDKRAGGEGHPLIICPMGGSPVGDEDRHESRCSRRVTTHADPSLLVLHCACESATQFLVPTSPAHREREIVSSGVAGALCHAARTLPPAGSSSWTPREKGLRVLAGSGEKTLSPRGESSLPGDTQSARADSAPTPSCGTARITSKRKLNTPHSPQLAPPPASRPPRPINQRRIIRNSGFYLPTPKSNSHPEVSLPRRVINSHSIAFISCHLSHYKVLTPYGDC